MTPRDVLISLSLKYKGDWSKILDTLKNRETGDLKEYSVEELGCGVVTIIDSDYPEALKSIINPPFVLYYYGDFSLLKDIKNNLSVIGSRDYSEYGMQQTIAFVSALSKNFNIVSGLARGIDGIAHRACLNSNGKTIAILGSGIDYIYPSENTDLYNEIKKNGLIISEYPLSTPPEPNNFPARNRLIAGLSDSVLVTEAYNKSGTLVTVRFALETNRNVMCIPYPAGKNSYCNRLISEGAFLVDSPEDVIAIIGNGKI